MQVAAPLVQRHALVQPVQRLVGPEAVLAELLGAGLVGDDERDLVERAAERLRDLRRPRGRRAGRSARAGTPGRMGTSGIRGGASAWRPYPSRHDPHAPGLIRWRRARPGRPDASAARRPTRTRSPRAFLVTADDGTRLHFHDWGGPVERRGSRRPAHARAAASRRGRGRRSLDGSRRRGASWSRTCAGTGLSDAPMDGYDLATLGARRVAVADGRRGALDGGAIVLAGHGFGAPVAAAARRRGSGGGARASYWSTAASSASR